MKHWTVPWHVLYRPGMRYELISRKVEPARPVLTRPGHAAPSLIEATADLTDLDLTVRFVVRVSSGGTTRVTHLEVDTKSLGAEGAVTSRALRSVRLDELVRETVRRNERPVTIHKDGTFRITGDADGLWSSFGSVVNLRNHEEVAWTDPAPRHRRTPRQQAEEAARIYTEAVASGSRAPTLAVVNQTGYSRSQVSRMIRTARDLGLLSGTQQQETR